MGPEVASSIAQHFTIETDVQLVKLILIPNGSKEPTRTLADNHQDLQNMILGLQARHELMGPTRGHVRSAQKQRRACPDIRLATARHLWTDL
jgi:hypothetical protein